MARFVATIDLRLGAAFFQVTLLPVSLLVQSFGSFGSHCRKRSGIARAGIFKG
ncbi:hypothetical protein SAMN06297144_1940 [Sphingomonas guangdongensis]|uniref:Uncharacterized protein n=1 Tax=Sphingomonas guangdongensis TaxID=1141890 RepID=A0A285QZL7_9SPHN|nr:hypothetical protein SAMN06297144_1940 [Sphingomonas guangdongensis]